MIASFVGGSWRGLAAARVAPEAQSRYLGLAVLAPRRLLSLAMAAVNAAMALVVMLNRAG